MKAEDKTWLQLDGESAQLRTLTEQPTEDIFARNRVVVGKLPASCSGVTQPCDVGTCFLAAKALIRSAGTQNLEVPDEFNARVRDFLKLHGIGLDSRRTKLAVNGIYRCFHVLQRAVNVDSIKESFALWNM